QPQAQCREKLTARRLTLITPNDHSFSISTHNDGHRIEGCVDAKHWAVFYSIILPRVRSIVMDTFLKIFIVTILPLGCIGWLADRRAATKRSDVTPGLSLLPGDIKYESPNGNVRIYFPIVTSIVLSVVLTLILRLFS